MWDKLEYDQTTKQGHFNYEGGPIWLKISLGSILRVMTTIVCIRNNNLVHLRRIMVFIVKDK